jgi:hypothetical protein
MRLLIICFWGAMICTLALCDASSSSFILSCPDQATVRIELDRVQSKFILMHKQSRGSIDSNLTILSEKGDIEIIKPSLISLKLKTRNLTLQKTPYDDFELLGLVIVQNDFVCRGIEFN